MKYKQIDMSKVTKEKPQFSFQKLVNIIFHVKEIKRCNFRIK